MVYKLIIICVCLLLFYFIFLNWKSNRELKKLRRNYNEDENKSRRGAGIKPRPSSTGCGEAINRNLTREPSSKGDGEPKIAGVLSLTEPITSSEDKREPGNNSKKVKLSL